MVLDGGYDMMILFTCLTSALHFTTVDGMAVVVVVVASHRSTVVNFLTTITTAEASSGDIFDYDSFFRRGGPMSRRRGGYDDGMSWR